MKRITEGLDLRETLSTEPVWSGEQAGQQDELPLLGSHVPRYGALGATKDLCHDEICSSTKSLWCRERIRRDKRSQQVS